MGRWKCNAFSSFCVIGILGVMACSKPQSVEEDIYLRCNDTSNGQMAEVKDGYYFASGGFLYYADKENLETWVPVCNKPECKHKKQIGEQRGMCNAELPSYSTIWQKHGKLYETEFGMAENPYVYEITMDGSGLKKVYEIPMEFRTGSLGGGYEKATAQNEFVVSYGGLNEDGLYQDCIVRLYDDEKEEGKIELLYEGISEDTGSTVTILSGKMYWSIRGDNVFLSSLYLEENDIFLNNLCRAKDGKIEPLNLPDDASVYAGYLDGDVFSYYNPNEGFYQYNIATAEKKLLFENALEDAKGYILANDCIVECNRYLDSMPEEAYLKVYNGERWMDLEVPEEVANRATPFYPLCIASDRLFFRMTVTEGHESTVFLYYMMLEEENPELVYAGKIGDAVLKEPVLEEETKENNSGFYVDIEDVMVFDTEDYFVKVIGVGENPEKPKEYIIDLYWENRSKDITYELRVDSIAINGLQCEGTGKAIGMLPETTSEQNDGSWNYGITQITISEQSLKKSKIDSLYTFEEFTDIAILWEVYDEKEWQETLGEKMIHVYPQGEEQAIQFVREFQSSDQILVDNEYITVVATGFETDSTIHLFLQNKTNKELYYSIQDSAVNGLMEDRVITTTTSSAGILFAETCQLISPTLIESSFLSQYQIAEIGKLEFAFKLYEMENGSVTNILMDDEDILTAYPLGEEHELHFVRESKSTDKVILDNEYVTLIVTGFEQSNTQNTQIFGEILNQAVGFYIVNKTENCLAVKIEDMSLNGAMVNSGGNFKYLFPGNSELTTIHFYATQLSPYGIKNIAKQEHEAVFTVFEPILMDGIIVGSKKDLITTKFSFGDDGEIEYLVREEQERDVTLCEENDVRIAFIGLEDFKLGNMVVMKNAVLSFYMENKTDKDVKIVIEDMVINGVQMDVGDLFGVFAGMCRVDGISVNNVLKEHNMESIEDVEMSLKVYEYDYEDATMGKELGNKTVTFGPKK